MPALAGGSALASMLPWLVGGAMVAGDVSSNITNKANLKNQENATAAAKADALQAQQTAMGNLNTFNKANPAPTATATGPKYAGQNVPMINQGGQLSGGPSLQGAGAGQINPQLLAQAIQQMQAGKGPGMA